MSSIAQWSFQCVWHGPKHETMQGRRKYSNSGGTSIQGYPHKHKLATFLCCEGLFCLIIYEKWGGVSPCAPRSYTYDTMIMRHCKSWYTKINRVLQHNSIHNGDLYYFWKPFNVLKIFCFCRQIEQPGYKTPTWGHLSEIKKLPINLINP